MKKSLLTLALLTACLYGYGQGTVEDYKRAYSIRGKYSGKMLNGDVRAHAIDGTHKFWYTETTKE